jgi:nucleotide-binding universal stress UspA family protein
MRSYVVAGVDGSPSSVAAAEYAAGWAAATGSDLHLVHGYLHPFGYGVGLAPFPPGLPPAPRSGDAMLRRVAADLATGHPGLAIQVRQVAGGPAGTLVEESRWAALTVVGSRGDGAIRAALLGSTAHAVAAHAHGPVIVVRPEVRPLGPDRPVVVGVDGSPGGEPALGLAFETAARNGAPVVAVHVWWAKPLETLRNRGEYVPARVEGAAGRLLATTVEPWRAKYPDVRLVEKLVHSLNPAEELIEDSADAGLVVVGSRGHGGFAGLLLGSVSRTVIQHAHCPVAIGRDR